MVSEEEKVYFLPGQIVRLKLDIPYKPDMIVLGKVTNVFKHLGDKSNTLKGIRCMWFNTLMELLEGIFSTKDLEFVQ